MWGSHLTPACRFINEKCRACGKTGHIAKVCRSQGKERQHTTTSRGSRQKQDRDTSSHSTHRVDQPSSSDSNSNAYTDAYTMFTLSSRSNPIILSVKLNGCPTAMELDMGASFSVMGDSTLKALLGDSVSITPSDVTLRTYTGEVLPVLGQVDVTVAYESQVFSLPLVIIRGSGVTLFGRSWLEHIQLDWSKIHSLREGTSGLQLLLDKHQLLFREELGTLKGMEATIHVPPNVQPRFYKARPLPYAMKEKVERELDRLQEAGVITPVEFSD